MKAADFEYQRPDSLDQALQLIADPSHDTVLLAGGQSLMPMMHLRLAQPDVLVDLNAISELDFIRRQGNDIEIGSMTRYATLETSALVQEHIPLFTKALPHIAHSAIRNRGTIGGSAALADPSAEMPALLKALDAQLTLVSHNSERQLGADDFFTGIYETDLAENEVVKSIRIASHASGNCCGFYEITRRLGDYAMAGVAITARHLNPVTGIRIVFFGVAEQALRAGECEQLLEGKNLSDEKVIEAAKASLSVLPCLEDLQGDVTTKRKLAAVALGRALQEMQS